MLTSDNEHTDQFLQSRSLYEPNLNTLLTLVTFSTFALCSTSAAHGISVCCLLLSTVCQHIKMQTLAHSKQGNKWCQYKCQCTGEDSIIHKHNYCMYEHTCVRVFSSVATDKYTFMLFIFCVILGIWSWQQHIHLWLRLFGANTIVILIQSSIEHKWNTSITCKDLHLFSWKSLLFLGA